ncbi:MAG TPA: lamin tail domain-containing protein, partial [Polyangium sp.]|nr:lamin tail domain-containing protein [Polyangium sp.]
NTNDSNACTTDACDPMTGVSHTPVNTNDSNACTTDACDPMTGISHTPVMIDDGNACTTDACDPMTGVSHTPVNVDDANACTVDACNPVTGAITHNPVNVDDGNACTTDTCNTMTGAITHAPVNVDDGNACTTDTCNTMTGAISHDPVNVDDMVACTADACDSMTGESHITNDSMCGPLNVCDLTGCVPTIPADQTGSVIITEFSALGSEFVELYNTTAAPIDIRGYVVRSGTSQALSIRSATDPTDAMSTPVTIAANGYVWGVVNPASAVNIPPGAAFVIGAPGASLALGDTGDAIALYGVQGLVLQDLVDFTQLHANPNAAMPATAFPAFTGVSTQVEPTLLTATGNDGGANWCTSFYPATGVRTKVADTKGAANGSCKVAVINEALIDPSSTDDGKAFIEIAGPGGGLAAGMKLDDIEGVTAPIGVTKGAEMVIPAGTRIPVDNILLLADELGTTGTTQVPGFTPADVILNDVDYENSGGDAMQLISANNVLLDAVGQSATGTNFASNVAANGFAMYETQVTTFPTVNASLARNTTSTDTDHNANDFHGDPSPTPGAANDLVNLTITSLAPDDGLATVATPFTVFGTDFASGMTLAVGGNAAATCTYTSSTQMTCTAPTNAGTVARVGVVATNLASVGAGTFTLPNSFTYTGVLNELGVAGEADFCNVQFPTTFTVTAGQLTPLIYGRIFEDTVTQPAGAPAGVLAELGYGPAAWTPLTQNATTGFMTAPFNTQVGNDDEFQISFVAPATAGMYRYVYRFSLDGGLNYTYCDTDGAGSNPGLDFNAANAGLMTVQ